jgi:hypothetical protein
MERTIPAVTDRRPERFNSQLSSKCPAIVQYDPGTQLQPERSARISPLPTLDESRKGATVTSDLREAFRCQCCCERPSADLRPDIDALREPER